MTFSRLGSVFMTLDQIQQVCRAVPFRRFYLETTGGSRYEIDNPDRIFFGPEPYRTMVVFDRAGRVHLVNEGHVASLAVTEAPG